MRSGWRGVARRLPWGFLGLVVIVAEVETYVRRHAIDFTETAAYSWTLSASSARREAKDADILCLGDSLVKHGVLPEILQRRLGGMVRNISTCAATAPAHFTFLKHAIEAGARPKAVVVDFMPGLLAGGPEYGMRYWPELLSTGELIELARSARSVDLATRTLLSRWFPTIRSRWEIRDHLVAGVNGEVDRLGPTNQTHRRNWGLNLGAQFTPDSRTYEGNVTREDEDRYLATRFWSHRVNRDYLERFLRLAETHSIQVYWLIPPSTPDLQALRDRSGADAKFTQFIRDSLKRHPDVVVLDARLQGFPSTCFIDPIHLTGRGALLLSESVASAIATQPRGWIDLSTTPSTSQPPPMEDLESSRQWVLSRLNERHHLK